MLDASIEICEIEGYVHVSKGYVHVSKSYVRVSKARNKHDDPKRFLKIPWRRPRNSLEPAGITH